MVNNEKVENIIIDAEVRYPLSTYYNGRLTEEEMEYIEKFCSIHCPSVYMNGSATYHIRWRKRINETL